MMIDEDDTSPERLEETTEMKVKVPVRQQLALHKLKVVTGKQISTAVTEAVEAYFQELDALEAADEAGAEAPEGAVEPG